LRLLTFALRLALASAPSQDVPLPPPPPDALPGPATPAAARPAVRIAFAGSAGFDFGLTDLLTVKMTNGTSQGISANQGLFAQVGAIVSHLDGRLEAQVTVGIKGWSVNATNGNASFVVFPIELLEAVNVAPFRFAAGVVYLHQPSTSGDGLLKDFNVKFDSSLGLVFQGEWVLTSPGRLRISMGPRFVWQKLRVQGGGPVLDANALGGVVSFSFL
jgi:hypothetical protein